MNLRNIQLQNICENTQLPNRAKRKRCYDVTSLWRMKQELGHLASGLECTGPAGGETQDVFSGVWRDRLAPDNIYRLLGKMY